MAFSLSLPITLFVLPASNANAAIAFVNTIPTIDPNLSTLVNGGVIGDKIRFTQAGVTSAVVTFTGTSNNIATAYRVGSTDTWEFIIPSGAKSGPASVSINNAAGTSAGIFQVWQSRGEPYTMPAGHLNVTYNDLQFILDQIKMSEAHADRTAAKANSFSSTLSTLSVNTAKSSVIYPYDVTSVNRCLNVDDVAAAGTSAYGSTLLSGSYVWTAEDPLGLRQVDGECNNISRVMAESNPAVPADLADTAAWGAAEQNFTRLQPRSVGSSNSDRVKYDAPGATVMDSSPRTISSLIADQSVNNPAAVAAATESADVLYAIPGFVTENSVNATNGSVTTVLDIPNITADYNVSAGYDSWFTLFGQFFDHGLDLIPKAGASVLIPLKADDPLYVNGSNANFMVLTRAANATTGESMNLTTPWIDQSQTYGSHPSQNVFVREYTFGNSNSTRVVPTGRLLDESIAAGGMPTWKAIKAQAVKFGIKLSDYDASSVPVIATNQYGKLIPGSNGYALMLFTNGAKNSFVWKEGVAGGLATSITISGATWKAVGSGHPFINDTTAAAVPFASGQCPIPNAPLAEDSDSIMNSAASAPGCTTYDNETLDAHLVAGDGRINENIGLSAVHNVFHAEHNLLVKDIENLLANNPVIPAAFVAEWNGERKYQAARFIMEMEYQHMVYDEFARRIAPELPVFLGYNPNVNAQITAEFASAVYRLGHSMLNETIARSNPGQFYDPDNNQDVSLITAFTNPAQARLVRPAVIASARTSGSSIIYTLNPGEKAPNSGSIVSISNMAEPKYNVTDGVVSSPTSGAQQTFTISTQYRGSTSAGPILPFPTVSPAYSKTASDGSNIAAVTISDPGVSGYAYTAMEAAASIAQGMSAQRGNEIDEFVTDGVRNNLLGLPLDLAALNITRGRDVGLPSLNNFRANSANGKLQPYVSWNSFIVNGLRHRESGVNFIAAYGTAPTIISATTVKAKRDAAMAIVSTAMPVFITGAVGSGTTITYSAINSYSIDQHVTVSGITGSASGCNVANAVITAATATSFDVSSTSASSCTGYVTMNLKGSGSGGSAIFAPQNPTETALAQSSTAFINGAAAATGLNDVDLWMGGLAENPDKQPLIPPMLGPTFQYVFTDQMQKLQDNDRFYYLSRLLGINLFGEIPAQKLTDIVRRTTPSPTRGIIGMNSPGFSIADCTSGSQANLTPGSMSCKFLSTSNAPFDLTNTDLLNMVLFADPASANPVRLSGGGGDDSIQGGRGNDLLSGGASGGDIVLGFEGNDIIFGGPGEDILNGGSGNDVINAGNSQAGDIADGGTGSDFIHCGMCSGIAVSFHGESGNDFIQGGLASDLALTGGEGDDWVEGGPGLDILNGDNGIFGNVLLGLPSYYGGNDVINPGAGLDAPFGDGGDDIFLLGQGSAVPDGSYGFDWASYEYNKRFDNGATTKPSVWADLGGTINPTTARSGDQLIFIEGLSGSTGNDQLFGGTGRINQVIPAGNVIGVRNSTTLTLTGTYTILPGSHIAGTGIAPNAIVTDFPAIKNGSTTTIRLSVANTSTVSGALTVSTEQLRVPSLITGLSDLVTNTPIWTTNKGGWSGGAILLGGEGNDSLYPSDGADVIHGSAYLHTCILLTSSNAEALAATDVNCDSGRGYSEMSLVARFMDSGAVLPTDLRIVREILPTSTRVTEIAATGSAVTYTANNNFYVGEKISVSGLFVGSTSYAAYETRNSAITAVTSKTFTISKTAPTLSAPVTGLTGGYAAATDTLDLSGGLTADPGAVPNAVGGISGPESQFTFTKITTPLPAGATYGCTVKDSVSGNTMYVYDVQMVVFTNGNAKAISNNCGGFDVPSALAAPAAVAGPTPLSATITWVAPATNGSPIDYYTVDYFKQTFGLIWQAGTYSAGTCSGTANNKQVAPNLLTCTVTGLAAKDVVRFQVRAHNAAGFSAASPNSPNVTVLATSPVLTTPTLGTIGNVPTSMRVGTAPFTVTNPTARNNSVTPAVDIAGTWSYASSNPAFLTVSGNTLTVVAAGSVTITGTFTPTNSALFNTATLTSTMTIAAATSAITPTLGAITYTPSTITSTTPSFTIVNPTARDGVNPVAGTFTYTSSNTAVFTITGNAATIHSSGTASINLSFVPTDPRYATTTASLSVTVPAAGGQTPPPVQTPTPGGNAAAIVTTPGAASYSAISTVKLSVPSAGTARTVFTTNTAGCKIIGTDLTAAGALICHVVANILTTPAQTTATDITFTLANQDSLRISNTVSTTARGNTLILKISGGSGSGPVTYDVVSSNGATCSVTNGVLTSNTAGTCSVTATKAASSIYNSVSSNPKDFIFN